MSDGETGRGTDDATGRKTAPDGVQSLVRGLRVLIAVNEHSPAKTSEIVRATGLPKATVIRLLATLRGEGFIAPDSSGVGQRPLPKVRLLASAMLVANPFLTATQQLLNEAAPALKWPTDFLLAEENAMVMHATNRDVTPIMLKRFEQQRFPLLKSASGLAFLAAASRSERQRLVGAECALLSDAAAANALAEEAQREVAEVSARGYGLRDYHAPMEGVRVAALPVVARGRPVGALAFVFLRDVITLEQFEATYLPPLRNLASRVGRQYTDHAPR